EDEDEICVIYGATLRAYSVLYGLLQAGIPGKRLLFIRPPADPDAILLNYERRFDVFEAEKKKKCKDGDDEILKITSLKGDLASFAPFDDHDTQFKLKKRNIYLNLEQEILKDGMQYQHILNYRSIELELSGISTSECECLEIGDPRAGNDCPVTDECEEVILDPTDRRYFCTTNYQPDFCTCTSAIYPDNEQ
ncbi:MAG: hypothetical protein EZS28_008058, partial [Streblomastix strix]